MPIPKVLDAIWLVRKFAAKIEADLERQYNRDICDWHTGAMSSRKLLVLLDNLVDPSVCMTAEGWPLGLDNPWPESIRIAAETHREVALNRAAKYVGSPNQYEPKVFIPREDRLERFLAEVEEDQFSEQGEADLFDSLGWS